MRYLAAAVIVCALAPLARAQSPRDALTAAAPMATITGRVVADDTGDPLANARVTILPAMQGTPVVLTDREGRFTLSAPGARRHVAANKVGYARQEVNVSAAGEPIEIRLRRAAALSGRIVDAFGEPVVSARVVVETRSNGQKDPTLLRATSTDDRGEYRVGGLSAGAFFVAVTTLDATATAQVTGDRIEMQPTLHKIYYPGTGSSSEAEPIRVELGEDRSDVDMVIPAGQSGGVPFGMMAGAPLARGLTPDPTALSSSVIRGRIVSTDGHPLAHAHVRLFPGSTEFPVRAIEADADGRFEFTDLVTGTFRIGAAKPG
ncbi:MAG TPA: carboxypeptidase regulatory-like domain-containing protein, partial [Vicinamibacterales bacterium]|nr:carboxypeptidase regulatory-like domain-containing protein [Vicinamibacterales bacterium]